MKTKKNLILLALFIVSTFTSCGEKEYCRSVLTEPQKQLIPYGKGAVCSYINSEGTVIDFTVTESKMRWFEETVGANAYSLRELKSVVLKSEADSLEIELRHTSADCARNGDYSPIVFFFNKIHEFRLRADAEGNFLTNASNLFYYDSLEINNTMYYDVVKNEYSAGGHTVKQLYYNTTYGILQINRGNESFTINPKPDRNKSTIMKSENILVNNALHALVPDDETSIRDNQDFLKSLESTSGISVIPPVDFTVYPNPNEGYFTVKVSGDVQPFTLEIFNDKGRLIKTIRGENEVININETKFVKGAYFVRIYMGGKTAVRKIVVK